MLLFCVQELIEQAAQVRPSMLPPLQEGLASYLASVTGTEGQGKLLLSRQGCWEWGVDLPAAATLLQGLTLAADLKLPTGVALLPPSFKADLPQRWVCLCSVHLMHVVMLAESYVQGLAHRHTHTVHSVSASSSNGYCTGGSLAHYTHCLQQAVFMTLRFYTL